MPMGGGFAFESEADMRDIVIAAMVALLLAVLVYTAVDKLQPTRMPHLTPPEPELPPPTATLCLLYTSPSPRDQRGSRMPSSA